MKKQKVTNSKGKKKLICYAPMIRLKPEMQSVGDSTVLLLLNQNILMQDKYGKSGYSASGVLSTLSKAV